MHTVFAMYIKSKIFRHCPTALVRFALGRISDFAGFYKRAAIHALRFLRSDPVLCDLTVFCFKTSERPFPWLFGLSKRKLFLLLFLSSCLREIAGAK